MFAYFYFFFFKRRILWFLKEAQLVEERRLSPRMSFWDQRERWWLPESFPSGAALI